jgi:hypothetical protein
MQTIKHLILAGVLFTAPSTAFAGAYHDLAREPHGIEVPVPEPAPAPAAPAAKKITIYTAKTIVTEDPGSGRATTRLSPTESRTSPKTTSPSGSPRCTSAGSKP